MCGRRCARFRERSRLRERDEVIHAQPDGIAEEKVIV